MGAPAPREDFDPREGDEWFQRLPELAQAEMRERWRVGRVRERWLLRLPFSRVGRAAQAGAVTFAFVGLFDPFGRILLAIPAGALVCAAVEAVAGGPLVAALLAGAAYFAQALLVGLFNPFALLVWICVGGLFGVAREWARWDGARQE